jgi:hypothetical protein
MANTVSILSYANTFGDWVVTTNALAKENNDIAANNYTKPTGTLILNDPSLGLQVATNSVFYGPLQVTGLGSYANVTNNFGVAGQVYLSNTTLSLVTSGQANVGGPIFAKGSGTGLNVANNAFIGNQLTVGGNQTVIGNSYVTGNTSITNGTANNFFANTITALNVNLIGTSSFNNLNITGALQVGGNFVINGTTIYNSNVFTINANTAFPINASYTVYRSGGSNANAAIRWNESQQYWDILDVNNSNYYKILTTEYLSDSVSSASSTTAASSNAVYNLANTVASLSSSFKGTTGSASSIGGGITMTSTNGVTITATGNTLTYNTPQDLRTSASPTFAGLSLTSPLTINQGGTGATSSAQALTNLLPTGQVAGYVLTTGGTGTYYWAAGGSGGGGSTTPGTTINSTRLFPTVNVSQTLFATPTYIPGASQLRVYVNGVRQFNSDYTETSNTSVTLNNAASAGDVIMMEVDGYINNPYYANNITFTAPFGAITSSANTIQLALQDLETRKYAANANAQFYSVGVGTASSTNYGEIRAAGQITAYYSDDRLKTKLGSIDNALDKLMTLTGFYYEPNEVAQSLGYSVKREVGLSAQAVQQIQPEVVQPAPVDAQYLTVQYERLVPLLVEAIKELKAEVDALKGK